MSESDDNLNPENGRQLAAAEYVLGVTAGAERRQAEDRLARDAAFADEVAFWEKRLGRLAGAVAPVAPPSDMWSRIDRALNVGEVAPRRRESLWHSLAFWRPFAIGSAALAAASIGALTYLTLSPAPRMPLMAMLDSSGGQPSFMAAVAPGGTSVMVMPASLATSDQRAMELWLIPPGDRPHSLGLIESGRAVKMNVPPDLVPRMTSDAVLAVSLEPPGGSPTGLPTGPVIANGKLTAL
jgi:anti-sigma-K factor RskA